MPRRKPRRGGNKQHSKGKKRPRGWHRRSKVRIHELNAWVKRIQRHSRPKQAEEDA